MPEEDLEVLLRRSLSAQADRIEPAADGLRRIRARTVRRPRRSRWRVPVLALAGAAAVVAALLVAPSVLPALQPSQQAAGRSAAPAVPGPTPIPGAGVNDLPTVWPYGSRAEGFRSAAAGQAAGTYGDLTKPDQVAVRFVGSYLGSRGLEAVPLGAYQAGLRVQVNRDGRPITALYLVRVRVGDDAPYVVADAEAPFGLTLDRVPSVPSSGLLVARGTVLAPLLPHVQLRAPGADLVLSGTVGVVTGTEWSGALNLPDGTRAATLTAWTVGPDGSVRAFASRPLG